MFYAQEFPANGNPVMTVTSVKQDELATKNFTGPRCGNEYDVYILQNTFHLRSDFEPRWRKYGH